MVAPKPDLGKIGELVIVGDHLRHQVAVIVDDRHPLGALVIQFAGGFALQHKVLVDKRFHKYY